MPSAVFLEGAKAAAKAVPVVALAAADAPVLVGIAIGVVLTGAIAYGTLYLRREFL
jgi:hypothetical protein